MDMHNIPFRVTNWNDVDPTEHSGISGKAIWLTQQFDTIRVRIVEYTPGYLADHWCEKGHILFCVQGQLDTELIDGRRFVLLPGMSYQVADHAEAHRSSTQVGAKLFIVDQRWIASQSSARMQLPLFLHQHGTPASFLLSSRH